TVFFRLKKVFAFFCEYNQSILCLYSEFK
ncbi:hypothetical protein CPC698_0655B, partial [Chlamydia psittaci C6/98]